VSLYTYIVYWNSYAVFNDYRQLRIPLPLTKLQMMLMANFFGQCKKSFREAERERDVYY
jgi:hypothetical protein